MIDDLDYLYALGEARSCLAALADSTDDGDLSAHGDSLLIQLDFITEDVGAACFPVTGTRAALIAHLEGTVDRLIGYGVNGLSLELLLDSARNPASVGPDCQD